MAGMLAICLHGNLDALHGGEVVKVRDAERAARVRIEELDALWHTVFLSLRIYGVKVGKVAGGDVATIVCFNLDDVFVLVEEEFACHQTRVQLLHLSQLPLLGLLRQHGVSRRLVWELPNFLHGPGAKNTPQEWVASLSHLRMLNDKSHSFLISRFNHASALTNTMVTTNTQFRGAGTRRFTRAGGSPRSCGGGSCGTAGRT